MALELDYIDMDDMVPLFIVVPWCGFRYQFQKPPIEIDAKKKRKSRWISNLHFRSSVQSKISIKLVLQIPSLSMKNIVHSLKNQCKSLEIMWSPEKSPQ